MKLEFREPATIEGVPTIVIEDEDVKEEV